MYARSDPYKGEDFRDTLRKICDRRVNKRPVVPETCPPKMVDLMKKCWSPDPLFRPQAKDLDTRILYMHMRDTEPLEPSEKTQAVHKQRPTGDMLYELFPKHVADQLKAGQKVEPESHDEVTIIFSDIIKFTSISKRLSPLKVSQMLDRLYLAFDRVARKNQVFKVETIGDAYMGVTNLDNDQMDTHVKHAAEFAIDMVIEANKILIDEDDPSKGYVNIRVGFHSGAVVSNVIGSLNPRYSLFGDAVNTASRMESNSKKNRILCSESAYKLLVEQAPKISLRKGGKINVKGKGDMAVFWVADDAIRHHGSTVSWSSPTKSPSKAVGSVLKDDGQHDLVDEQYWRQELLASLKRLDSDDEQETEQVMRQAPEQAPPRTFKPYTSGNVQHQVTPEQAPPKPHKSRDEEEPPQKLGRRSSSIKEVIQTHRR